MDSEDELRRPRPLRPYQTGTAKLHLPRAGLDGTLWLLQKAGCRESGTFWYGTRDEAGNGCVTYVAAPEQRMAPRNYHVTPDAITAIVCQLPDDWKVLAQIHSHPGFRVEHSRYDDRMASSRRALSLVFPFYGHISEPFPSGVGVHEFQIDYWHLLEPSLAEQRVVLCGGEVKLDDFR